MQGANDYATHPIKNWGLIPELSLEDVIICCRLNLKKCSVPCKVNSSRGHGFETRRVHQLS
jgi:hypothetical protein